MQENKIAEHRYEEDEIDLKELVKTLWKNKIKIIAITSVITILAIIYAYMVPKVYEAKAIVKIGTYKQSSSSSSSSGGDGILVTSNTSELVRELEVIFIELLKNDKDRVAKVEKIALVKKQKNLFEIVVNGDSNANSIAEVEKVISYTKEKHKKVLDDVVDKRTMELKQLNSTLSIMKERTLPVLTKKIKRYKNNIEIYEQNFKDVLENIKKIRTSNPTLATIQINEQKYLADMLITLRNSLEGFEARKSQLELLDIPKVEEKYSKMKSLLKEENYKNTEAIGNIMTNDFPIKPKKKLIVIVAFITGFILSIFLVFFLEFIRGFKEEENLAS